MTANGEPQRSSSLVDLVLLVACGGVAAVGYFYWWNLKREQDRWVPSAPGVGLIQTVRGFSSSRLPQFLRELSQKSNNMTCRLNLPLSTSKGAYLVGEGPLSREILKDPATDKSKELGASLARYFGGRLTMFTSTNNEFMKTLRKGTMLAFSKNQVSRMNSVASRYVDELCNERFPKLYVSEQIAFDPGYEFNRLTFRVICEAAFEYTDVTDDDYDEVVKHLDFSLKEYLLHQLVNPLRASCGFLIPSARAARKSSDFVRAFIRKMMKAYNENPNKASEPTLIKLINEIPALANDQAQKEAELVNWLIAGHDTTGYSLSNILILLSKYPRVQDKLRRLLQGKREPQTVDYFQYVLNESSRLVPVAPFASRVVGRDFTTKDGYIIPKGGLCFLGMYHANRDSTIYENPDEFYPERWEQPTQAMLDQHFPFAVGPRNCPGQALAMAEIHSTIPRLLQKFSFEIVEEGEEEFFLTFKILGARLKARSL